jgi:hypothetical protein
LQEKIIHAYANINDDIILTIGKIIDHEEILTICLGKTIYNCQGFNEKYNNKNFIISLIQKGDMFQPILPIYSNEDCVDSTHIKRIPRILGFEMASEDLASDMQEMVNDE